MTEALICPPSDEATGASPYAECRKLGHDFVFVELVLSHCSRCPMTHSGDRGWYERPWPGMPE